jgi:hypothetical protein
MKRDLPVNVTEQQMRAYLETFNRTYLETVTEFFNEDQWKLLYRVPLLLGETIGYVSTQFGAAFEYTGRPPHRVSVRRGRARIEDLLTGAPKEVRHLPAFAEFDGTNSSLGGLTAEGFFPFRILNDRASVTLLDIRFRVGNWERNIELAEVFGNRSSEFWSPDKAVARARSKDEILLAALQINRAAKRSLGLKDYIDRFKAKTVLVLGDYAEEGRHRLRRIRDGLSRLGYEPILLEDIPDRPEMDLQQKLVAVGAVSRFVVIDDSSKAGHMFELPSVRDNRWVAIVLRLEGSEGSFMTRGLAVASNVILERTYRPDAVDAVLTVTTHWAEERLTALRRKFSATFPWRFPEPT